MSGLRDSPRAEQRPPIRVEDLVALLGKEAAFQLCQLCGGQRVPSLQRLGAFARRQRVIADYLQGYPLGDLALKYGLSLAGVKKIIVQQRIRRLRLEMSGILPSQR